MSIESLEGPLTAPARTDWFVDPATGEVQASAPLRLIPVSGDFQLRAHVEVPLASMYDAGTLFVHGAESTWGKLALERSPEGTDMIVTVITRGVSDDANGVVVPNPGSSWLRISRTGEVYTFHYSADGVRWSLARLFTLGPVDGHQVGVGAQSPTGDGLTATFTQVSLVHETLADPRDGS